MQNSVISEKIKMLCKQKNISISSLLQVCDINRNFLYDLERKGKSPSIDKLLAIADYFDCSIDDLVGRSNNQSISTGDITNNSGIIGNNNNNIQKNSELSVQEQDILRIYRSSDGKTQMEIMKFIYNIEENRKGVE